MKVLVSYKHWLDSSGVVPYDKSLHMHAQLHKHFATHSLNLPALPPGRLQQVSSFKSIQ